MGTWDPDLFDIVSEFPPKLKQAMFASANNGTIRRGTWNHCALNAASELQEAAFSGSVASFEQAKKVFGITAAQAKVFVRIWDTKLRHLETDEAATEYLKEIILRAGLFEPAKVNLSQIVVFRSQADREEDLKTFEELMAANGIADLDIELAQFFFCKPEEVDV